MFWSGISRLEQANPRIETVCKSGLNLIVGLTLRLRRGRSPVFYGIFPCKLFRIASSVRSQLCKFFNPSWLTYEKPKSQIRSHFAHVAFTVRLTFMHTQNETELHLYEWWIGYIFLCTCDCPWRSGMALSVSRQWLYPWQCTDSQYVVAGIGPKTWRLGPSVVVTLGL